MKRSSKPPTKKKYTGPQTLEEFLAMPEHKQDIYTRVTQTVTKVRDRVSLRRAAREFGLDPRTVKHIGGPGLRKGKNGRYTAKSSDKLLRPLLVLTPKGPRQIGIRDSRHAALVAEHWNAAHRYLETGDKSVRRKFRGKSFMDASGKKIRLMTDLKELERHGHAGELSFESIYPK